MVGNTEHLTITFFPPFHHSKTSGSDLRLSRLFSDIALSDFRSQNRNTQHVAGLVASLTHAGAIAMSKVGVSVPFVVIQTRRSRVGLSFFVRDFLPQPALGRYHPVPFLVDPQPNCHGYGVGLIG